MTRQMIQIDKNLCNGCGLCVNACHEGALGMVDGKATLLRDDYCDGLGNCLPVCPTGAIAFETREAAAFDPSLGKADATPPPLPCGCPGTHAKTLIRNPAPCTQEQPQSSALNQWPVQLKLVPVNAAYFHNASLLIAADCAAYACGSFHNDFMQNKITLIGCPKLDEGDYSEKLTTIFKENEIKSVTVVRMEVPCCAGIENAVKTALANCGKQIPWQSVTLTTNGEKIN